VRDTLLGTGIATAALENRDPRYIAAARRLWDNMTGRRMFVTGGVGAIPHYIYATRDDALYVNLFIGNDADLNVAGHPVKVSQHTAYPYDGDVEISVDPQTAAKFAVIVRIPGWARGVENPDGLYTSDLSGAPVLKVNGKEVRYKVTDGYATLERKWRRGDRITLSLPMQPRVITAHEKTAELAGQACVASGPVIYAFESTDNADLGSVALTAGPDCTVERHPELLSGVSTIRCGSAVAIPYYSIANRGRDTSHRVWVARK